VSQKCFSHRHVIWVTAPGTVYRIESAGTKNLRRKKTRKSSGLCEAAQAQDVSETKIDCDTKSSSPIASAPFELIILFTKRKLGDPQH
jgi:hypothetical protein